VRAYGSPLRAPGATHPTTGGVVNSAFPAEYDAASQTYSGEYDQVLASLGGEPGRWDAKRLMVAMSHQDVPAVEDDHVSCYTEISDDAGDRVVVEPGTHVVIDRRYCFSRVNLRFQATSGAFYGPLVSSSSGRFDGVDFLGRDVGYDADVFASGTPMWQAEAASQGNVTMGMPQGQWVLQPYFSTVNAGGGSSMTQVMPVPLTVGCRQILDVYPEIGVAIGAGDVPPCAEAGVVTVTGAVRSVEPVDRITYGLAGQAPQTWCTSCGMSPTFSIDVVLPDEDNEIVVSAVDASGRTASLSAFTRWAREPSATDRRTNVAPLRVRRAAAPGNLALQWEAWGTASLYRGDLLELRRTHAYTHRGFDACGVDGGALEVRDDAGSWYFLVGGTCEWGDGSLGRDSFGRERPPARDRCP
jgi:hypothetical protein